jgi:long-chain acyl-CoA synthetase
MDGDAEAKNSSRRRLQMIHAHLSSPMPAAGKGVVQLEKQPTASEFHLVDGYSVVLPEKLSTGKWQVHRSIKSPLQLLDHWPDHPEIQTLHDNSVYNPFAHFVVEQFYLVLEPCHFPPLECY